MNAIGCADAVDRLSVSVEFCVLLRTAAEEIIAILHISIIEMLS